MKETGTLKHGTLAQIQRVEKNEQRTIFSVVKKIKVQLVELKEIIEFAVNGV